MLFRSPEGRLLYCLLVKALYGLKQGARQWYLKLSLVMRELGFRKVHSEPCVYIWENTEGDRVIVPRYVDDCHLVGNAAGVARTKASLKEHFELRDLGPTRWFLGIHITRDRKKRTLSLSQRQYCLDTLKEFEMENCRPVSTPMVPGLRLSKPALPMSQDDLRFMQDKPYGRAVGKLNWLALCTRPDISHAVGVLARFSSCPGPEHWKAVKHLLCYITGTVDYKLTYCDTPHPRDFRMYSDADFAGDADSGRSTSAYVLTMGGGAVSWSSKLQSRVARSTTEAEFIAGEAAGREIAFFRYILDDLGYPVVLPRPLAMDNQSAIRVAKNPEHQGKMKHLPPIYYGFRDQVEEGEVAPYFIPTEAMPADMLTKALSRDKVERNVGMLGLSG